MKSLKCLEKCKRKCRGNTKQTQNFQNTFILIPKMLHSNGKTVIDRIDETLVLPRLKIHGAKIQTKKKYSAASK